jgi:Starch-binding associating with outer membrane
MKKIISILIFSVILSACNTDLDINRDPDSPIDVPISSQLPSGIAGLIGSEGSYYALIGGFWSQYWTQSTSANQYKNIDGYIINSGDFFAAWSNMYDALGDIRNVKKKASEEKNWNYYLIATVLEAQANQVLTDFYGDIPYKEANNQKILQPKFDTSEEVYELMIASLNDALSKKLETSIGIKPGIDDLIFRGDMQQWTAFANTMKLKIYMRQTSSPKSATTSAAITSLLSSGVVFLDADAGMKQFTDEPNLSNPLYESDRRQLNVATNLRMSFTMSSFFNKNDDTRKAAYYGSGNPLYQGEFDNGSINASTISIVNLSATTPAYLMSIEESLFLQAEAQVRFGSSAVAKTLYDQAVIENFKKYIVNKTVLNGTSYVASGGVYEFPVSGTMEDKIKAIITQKWVANFPGNGYESFFDTNRTGYPKVSTVSPKDPSYVPGELTYSLGGATGGLFPKRIVYPQEETNTNPNTPLTSVYKITTPVWWAKK